MELVAFSLLLICHQAAASIHIQNAEVVTITRLNNGDVFKSNGGGCNLDTCVGLTSGTAALTSTEDATVSRESCSCQCHQHLPTFREDLRICVDDIHECVLAPFVSGSTSQKIPFVFLPLKGQIIHPSKEINFTGIQTPVCAVSGSKYLTENGWKDLRNFVDADVPFQLFIDEGRTFLQWTGETELRARMTGRLIVVHLLCRDSSKNGQQAEELESIFTPCVAFRVVGTPLKYLQNVSEVVFSADAQASEDTINSRLSVTEYIAIGICSILLGLIYVASVFLYLHIRKRKKDSKQGINSRDNQGLGAVEEGVIKSNPLLGLSRHFTGVDNAYSDSGSSDTEITPDLIQNPFDRKKNIQTTSALVHPQQSYYHCSPYVSKVLESMCQDSSNIERLPEENVSIIETIEGREERPDAIRAISGTTRKKLYFNPAYFEPELLLAPPPAALEFLTKIREVITIAKEKMACKKFSPSLLGIPEEENTYILDSSFEHSRGVSSRRSSMISLKRENSRRRTCTGCPACEPQDLKALCGKLPEFPSLVACQTCTSTKTDNKQRSIQKWLEDVPILKSTSDEEGVTRYPSVKSLQDFGKSVVGPKRIRSPTRSLSPSYASPPSRALSPKPASKRACSPSSESHPSQSLFRVKKNLESFSHRKSATKAKAPPPPVKQTSVESKELKRNILSEVSGVTVPTKTEIQTREMPTLTRNMKAVIHEFSSQHGLQNGKLDYDSTNSPDTSLKNTIEYEADSLERTNINKGTRTPTEYADLSSQPSPSLSSALPMAEEMTMRNAILNTKTGNMTVSRLNSKNNDSHLSDDYELIVVRKGCNVDQDQNLYNLPEYFHKSNGYSLVSEVYVNNGYSFGSNASSPSGSNCSTLERKKVPKIKYEQPETKPGQLTIEVEDCPDNYIRVEDSDNFEPDTLDRKPSRRSISSISINNIKSYDSFRRSNSILLRTTGSFKNSSFIASSKTTNLISSNFQRTFRSLREIYEYKKNKYGLRKSAENLSMVDTVHCINDNNLVTWKNDINNKDHEGKLLTLQERHLKRQRGLAAQTIKAIPPDVIPPPPLDNSVYEHPKPPRKIIIDVQGAAKPPLPPKNGNGRSTSRTQDIKPASPTSNNYCDMPSSSLSGTSVSPNSSDYEIYNTLGEDKVYNLNNQNLQTRSISSDPTEYRNAINNEFITQTPRTYHSFTRTKSSADDNNNSTHIYSNSSNNSNDNCVKKEWFKIMPSNNRRSRIIDSGYLSTDSNDSLNKPNDSEKDASAGSETDESLGDGHSESGAESVETHSVFFGTYRKPFYMSQYSNNLAESEPNALPEEFHTDDTSQGNYATVVPVDNTR